MSLKDEGYADGHYSCKCHTCDALFNGDKRAVTCSECAHEADLAAKQVELLREIQDDARNLALSSKTQWDINYILGWNKYASIIQDKINKLEGK